MTQTALVLRILLFASLLLPLVSSPHAFSRGTPQVAPSGSPPAPAEAAQHFAEAQRLLAKGMPEAALAAVQAGLKVAPRSVAGLILLGEIDVRKQDFVHAADAFGQALVIDPHSAEAHDGLGNTYSLEKQLDLAEKEFQAALRYHPRDRDANYNLGLLLLARNDPRGALTYFSRVQPQTPEVLYNLTQAYLAAGQTAKGLELARSLSHQAKDDVRAHFTLGLLLAKQKQYEFAIHEFETANALEPGTFEILFNLGQAYSIKGERRKARDTLNQALVLSPESPETLYLIARIDADEGQDLDALDLLVKAHKLAPRNTDVILLMAHLSMKQGYYQDAIPLLEQGLKVGPHRPDLLASLGESYFVSGKVEQALATFQTLLAVDPSSRSYAFVGVSYRHMGRFDEAKKYLQEGLKLDPRSVPCLYNMGYIATREGQYELGDRYLTQALQIDPNYSEALLELANSKMHQRKFAEAVPLLQRCAQLNPQASSVYYRLAEAERNLHQTAAAENDLKVFQTLSKNPPPQPYPFEHLYDYLGERAELTPQQKTLNDLAQLEQEVKLHSGQPQNYYMLAEAYLRAGRVDDARQALAHLDELSQGDFRTTVGVGVLLARYHHYDESIARFQQALQINPDSDDVWYDLADAHFRRRSYADALAALDRVSPEGRKDTNDLALRADVLAHLGRTGEAADLLRQVLAENPDQDQAYLSLALVYLRDGHTPEARAILEKGLARTPDAGDLLWGMGVVAVMEGQAQKAEQDLEKSVDLLPEWPGSYSALGFFYYQMGEFEKSRQTLERFKASGSRGGLDVNRIEQALAQAGPESSAGPQAHSQTREDRQRFLEVALAFADQSP